MSDTVYVAILPLVYDFVAVASTAAAAEHTVVSYGVRFLAEQGVLPTDQDAFEYVRDYFCPSITKLDVGGAADYVGN